MGKSSAETVREIEATRERLDAEIQELEHRLPPPARWAKRIAGVALGGGVAGSAFWFGVRKLRGRKKRQKVDPDRVQTVVQVLPEKWAERVSGAMEEGQWKLWAGAIAAVWLLLRLTELRQLRRMNRVLLTAPNRPY
jgi:hypothetical protein